MLAPRHILITTARVGSVGTGPNFRAVAISTDAGTSFGEFRPTNVPDPTCEGSTIGHSDGVFYMSSAVAATTGNRSNVSISVCDAACAAGGFARWRQALTVNPGPSSYSSLAAINQSTLLLLYEVGGGETISALELVTLRIAEPNNSAHDILMH